MDVSTIRAFFMWCTIINAVLLTLSFIICSFAADWAYKMHSKWFPISRETFNTAIYYFFGLYKVFFFVFNLIPFIALAIVG